MMWVISNLLRYYWEKKTFCEFLHRSCLNWSYGKRYCRWKTTQKAKTRRRNCEREFGVEEVDVAWKWWQSRVLETLLSSFHWKWHCNKLKCQKCKRLDKYDTVAIGTKHLNSYIKKCQATTPINQHLLEKKERYRDKWWKESADWRCSAILFLGHSTIHNCTAVLDFY